MIFLSASWPQGLPAWLWLGDRPLTLRSNLGSASVDKGTFSALQTVRSDATRFVRDQQQSRSQTMQIHSVRRASGLTRQLGHHMYRLFDLLTAYLESAHVLRRLTVCTAL